MTLFIIGNGFDLNCGMKTRYTDIYAGYVLEKSETPIVEKFKRNIRSDIENWSDFEMSMCQYASTLDSEQELLECVRDFSMYMQKHLRKENEKFLNKYQNAEICDQIKESMKDSMSHFYQGISNNVSNQISFRNAWSMGNVTAISFNYTNVFDVLFRECLLKYKHSATSVIHVHGSLDDAPVLGIDNINQLKVGYKISRKGERGFIKPVFNERYDSRRVELARSMIAQADTICTFGFSCGESDLTWRNALLNWLQENDRHHLFIYQYSLSDRTYRTHDEKMDIEDDAKEELLQSWGVEDSTDIFDRLHIPVGKNIFCVNI